MKEKNKLTWEDLLKYDRGQHDWPTPDKEDSTDSLKNEGKQILEEAANKNIQPDKLKKDDGDFK